MIDISPIQVVMVLIVALLAFGPRRLPELGRTIGRGVKEVRSALNPLEADATPSRPAPAPPSPPAVEPPAPTEVPDDLSGLIVPGDTPPADAADEASRENRE